MSVSRSASLGRVAGSLLLVASCSLGCAWAEFARSSPDCLVRPVSTAELPADLSLRARLRIGLHGREIGLELVARATPSELVVVGISEAGPRLFAVQQRGRDVTIDAAAPELERLAEYVMDALYRAFWIEAPPAGVGQGSTSASTEGVGLRDTEYEGGVRRTFEPSDAHVDAVTIDYPAVASSAGAGPVQVRNPSCGYEAIIFVL